MKKQKIEPPNPFAQAVAEMRKTLNLDYAYLKKERYLKIYGLFIAWETGKRVPKNDKKILSVCNEFGYPSEYLILAWKKTIAPEITPDLF